MATSKFNMMPSLLSFRFDMCLLVAESKNVFIILIKTYHSKTKNVLS